MMPNHPDGFIADDHCAFCQMYATSARYRELVHNPPVVPRPGASPAARPIKSVTVCVYLGDPVPVTHLQKLGIPFTGRERFCEAGQGVNGIVCPCKDCGPKRCHTFTAIADNV